MRRHGRRACRSSLQASLNQATCIRLNVKPLPFLVSLKTIAQVYQFLPSQCLDRTDSLAQVLKSQSSLSCLVLSIPPLPWQFFGTFSLGRTNTVVSGSTQMRHKKLCFAWPAQRVNIRVNNSDAGNIQALYHPQS